MGGVLAHADHEVRSRRHDRVEQRRVGVPAVAHVAPARRQPRAHDVVLAVGPRVPRPGQRHPARRERAQLQLHVQPVAVHAAPVPGRAVPGGGHAVRADARRRRPRQPGQRLEHRPVGQRDHGVEPRQPRVAPGHRAQSPGQFRDHPLDQPGVEQADRLREAAQREPPDADRPGHGREAHARLQVAERLDRRVPRVDQDQLDVLVEVELAIARRVPPATDLVQARQQWKHAPQLAEAVDPRRRVARVRHIVTANAHSGPWRERRAEQHCQWGAKVAKMQDQLLRLQAVPGDIAGLVAKSGTMAAELSENRIRDSYVEAVNITVDTTKSEFDSNVQFKQDVDVAMIG